MLRNSHDKRFPIGISFGSRVFVCDNLAFSAEHVIKRKHTANAKRELPGLVGELIEPLALQREAQHRRLTHYRETPLSDEDADLAIMQMYRQPAARKKLVSLAEDVWAKESPVDWGSDHWQPGKHLRALDGWILAAAGNAVTVDQMYQDIRAACAARILVAEDKSKKSKKQESDSIGSVAAAIVHTVEPKLKMRNFPDDFTKGATLDLPLLFDRGSLKEITIGRLLDTYEIEVRAKGGSAVYSATHPRPVAEAIVRAILLGRSTFSVSTDRKAMDQALDRFLEWVSVAESDIETAIAESAFGTGYEDALKREVYARLGIHPLTGAKALPEQISL